MELERQDRVVRSADAPQPGLLDRRREHGDRRTALAITCNADWWGVHFNSSRDDTLFASDGGDASQVAYATDGMWINLLRVQPDGTVSREQLVNMSRHNYVTGRGGVEPNVHITPDKKWVIFTGQFAQAAAAGLCGRHRQTLTTRGSKSIAAG